LSYRPVVSFVPNCGERTSGVLSEREGF